MDPAYLTTQEVADLLRVRERKVYDMVATGEIPHRKITGKLLFPQGELTAWIEGEGALHPATRPCGMAAATVWRYSPRAARALPGCTSLTPTAGTSPHLRQRDCATRC
jgi:excisionase family DNA binding protein